MRKALTITAPWAWAICHAGKTVENRTWHTTYRGPLLIHAGVKDTANERDLVRSLTGHPMPKAITKGAIVARAMLVDVVPYTTRQPDPYGLRYNRWAFGPYCWILEDVQPYVRPIPATGKLGLWTP